MFPIKGSSLLWMENYKSGDLINLGLQVADPGIYHFILDSVNCTLCWFIFQKDFQVTSTWVIKSNVVIIPDICTSRRHMQS